MKQILLLTDFSDTANNAITYARQLWADFECQFHLMHVVSADGYTTKSLITSDPSESLYSSLLKTAKMELQDALHYLKSDNDNAKHHFIAHLDHDSFLDAIEQLVKNEGIELVVMGSNGASNVKEVLFGSHALRAMRYLPHNIMVVPQDFGYTPVRRMLLLLQGQDLLTEHHLQHLHSLSQSLNAELYVLSVDAQGTSNKGLLCTTYKGRFEYAEVKDVPLEYAATTVAQTKSIDLIVMIGDLEGFTDRLQGYQGKTKLSKLYQTPLFLIRD